MVNSPFWYQTTGKLVLLQLVYNIVTPHAALMIGYFIKRVLGKPPCASPYKEDGDDNTNADMESIEGSTGGETKKTLLSRFFGSTPKDGKNDEKKEKQLLVGVFATQDQMNDYFLGPEFDLSKRYAQTIATIFLCLSLGSGMPVLYVVGFFSILVTYWVDKFLLMRHYRRPPAYNYKLGQKSIQWLFFALVVHTLVAIYSYGSGEVFATDSQAGDFGLRRARRAQQHEGLEAATSRQLQDDPVCGPYTCADIQTYDDYNNVCLATWQSYCYEPFGSPPPTGFSSDSYLNEVCPDECLAASSSAVPPALPSNVLPLEQLSSPYEGSTVGNPEDDNLSCAFAETPEQGFAISLTEGQTLTIEQTSNNYDSRHELRHGGPYPGNNVYRCIDDPDTEQIIYTATSDTTVYFIIGAYRSGGGNFVLEWSVQDAVEAYPGCINSCIYQQDGICDDGGAGSLYSDCRFGYDCTDCGPRQVQTVPAPTPSPGDGGGGGDSGNSGGSSSLGASYGAPCPCAAAFFCNNDFAQSGLVEPNQAGSGFCEACPIFFNTCGQAGLPALGEEACNESCFNDENFLAVLDVDIPFIDAAFYDNTIPLTAVLIILFLYGFASLVFRYIFRSKSAFCTKALFNLLLCGDFTRNTGTIKWYQADPEEEEKAKTTFAEANFGQQVISYNLLRNPTYRRRFRIREDVFTQSRKASIEGKSQDSFVSFEGRATAAKMMLHEINNPRTSSETMSLSPESKDTLEQVNMSNDVFVVPESQVMDTAVV